MNKKNEFPSFLKCRKCYQIVTLHGGNWKRWHWPKRYAYCVKCYRDDPEGYDSKLTRAASGEKTQKNKTGNHAHQLRRQSPRRTPPKMAGKFYP